MTGYCLGVGDETENLVLETGLEICVKMEDLKYTCLNTNNQFEDVIKGLNGECLIVDSAKID